MLAGLIGVLVALVLPFIPVTTEETTVTWPVPGEPVVSTTALFAPYRPGELTVVVPCSALQAAAAVPERVTVLATGPDDDGLVLRTEAGSAQLQLGSRVVSSTPVTGAGPDCGMQLHAGSTATVITIGAGRLIELAGEPVPKVFAFRTDLDPAGAAGLAVTARTASPFATSPTGLKIGLISVQLLAALLALGLLAGTPRWLVFKSRQPGGWRLLKTSQPRWRSVLVDIGVVGVLAGWAIIGPLTDDDGFATMIARNAAETGNAGNYYRWWNAAETPFALTMQLHAPLTQISLAPLWLRLPSTALGIATWFVVSRGVLGAALPAMAGSARIRLLAAVCLLAAWLPFNLGVRPEPYVAFGVTSVLALLWRARGLAGLGWAALLAGLTIPVSPGGILVAAPIAVFAPRIVAIVRSSARGRAQVLAHVGLLCCVGAVGLTAIFADQTWDGLVTATHWHNFFGPSLPWYREPDRYAFLLGADQSGSAGKRIPVLLTLALLPVIGVLLVRRTMVGGSDSSAWRLIGVVVTALALLWLTPSKWSHHFGALAGLFASFLVVAVVVLLQRAQAAERDRDTIGIALAGVVLVAAASALAFAGPNSWWQPAVYDVPWAQGPVRPIGLPLDSPLFWVGAVALAVAAARLDRRFGARNDRICRFRHRNSDHAGRVVIAATAAITVAAAGTAVVVLLSSFLAAPIRRPAGSLAVANLHQLAGGPSCALADDIEVLPDGPVLAPAGASTPDQPATGFSTLAGFDPAAPPPDPPGTGTSTQLWGSLVGGPASTGTLISPWFALPPGSGVAVSVSGRTDRGNELTLELGRAASPDVIALAQHTPFDQPKPHQDQLEGPPEYRPWRSIGLDATQIPAGADRVRIRAVDASTDPDGWLALTGPRQRSVVGLTEFLADHGPVLVSWPQAFLFPCVHDIVRVAGGLAEAPRAVIEAPRRHGRLSSIATDQAQGGNFAALRPFGQLHEIPTRLAGHPEIDWGALQLATDPTPRDTYQRTTTPGPGPRHGDISGSNQAR